MAPSVDIDKFRRAGSDAHSGILGGPLLGADVGCHVETNHAEELPCKGARSGGKLLFLMIIIDRGD